METNVIEIDRECTEGRKGGRVLPPNMRTLGIPIHPRTRAEIDEIQRRWLDLFGGELYQTTLVGAGMRLLADLGDDDLAATIRRCQKKQGKLGKAGSIKFGLSVRTDTLGLMESIVDRAKRLGCGDRISQTLVVGGAVQTLRLIGFGPHGSRQAVHDAVQAYREEELTGPIVQLGLARRAARIAGRRRRVVS